MTPDMTGIPYPMSDVVIVEGETAVTIHPIHNASCVWVQKIIRNPTSPGHVYWKYNGAPMTGDKQGFELPNAPDFLHLHYNGNDAFDLHFWIDVNCKLVYQFFRPSLYG
jgi:hypothetical protein